MVRLNEGRVLAFADLHRLGVLKHRPAGDEFGSGVLEKGFHALVQTVNDAFLPADEVAHFQFGRTGDGDAHVAVFGGVFGEVVEGVGGVDERFARNAAANQTRAAGSLPLDDDGLQAELCGPDGSDVASGASADNKNLALFCLHPLHLT